MKTLNANYLTYKAGEKIEIINFKGNGLVYVKFMDGTSGTINSQLLENTGITASKKVIKLGDVFKIAIGCGTYNEETGESEPNYEDAEVVEVRKDDCRLSMIDFGGPTMTVPNYTLHAQMDSN